MEWLSNFIHDYIIGSAFIEYYIAILAFGVFFAVVKWGDSKYTSWLAWPIALLYIPVEWLVNVLKGWQIKFVKDRVEHGSEIQVLIIFIVVGSLGFFFAAMAKIMGVLAITAPIPFLPIGLLSSVFSKYFNFVILPEVMQNGNDKLRTFRVYNFGHKVVMKLWTSFKTTKLYKSISSILGKVKTEVKIKVKTFKTNIVENYPQIVEFVDKWKKKKGVMKKLIAHVKENIAEIKNVGIFKSLKNKWSVILSARSSTFSDESKKSLNEVHAKIAKGDTSLTVREMKELIVMLHKEASDYK